MLLTYGINHKSAPLAVREQLSFAPQYVPEILHHLLHRRAVNEVVLLSTCNRTEVYTTIEHGVVVEDWLMKRSNDTIHSYCYRYQNEDMVRHVMRVACGLDSMVLGESQILKQMKQAFAFAEETGSVGTQLKKLFPTIFSVSKQVRSQTAIGENPVSIAYAVVQLAKRIFSKINTCKVLLIGAGNTIELVATHLHAQGVRQIIIANRTIAHAQKLADQLKTRPICMSDIPIYLKEVDVIITATASQLPILGKGVIESALHQRKHRPMFIADLAVPRDVEAEVGQLEDIYLYHLDDLRAIIEQNMKSRIDAAAQAEAIIEAHTRHYMRQLRVINAGEMIRNYREQIENFRDQELTKALIRLERTKNPQAALASLAHNLTNKIMHQPTIKLRQAAYNEQLELMLAAKELFDL